MSTIVFVHAHPDDESTLTSGSMARAADEGHRVIVVFATNGDHGTAPTDLAEGETVADARRREAEASAKVLGLAGMHWLGYADSGMTGWEQNTAPGALAAADPHEAADRLTAVLDEEGADVLVGYDWHGNYGHPDHVAVHRMTRSAADRAARRPRYLEATMNRDHQVRLYRQAQEAGTAAGEWDPQAPGDDGNLTGTPEAELHLQVDVLPWLDRKRAAMECHASQTSDIGMILAIPPEWFAGMFGLEHFIEPGREPGMRQGWILG